jgi:hypothetical protein
MIWFQKHTTVLQPTAAVGLFVRLYAGCFQLSELLDWGALHAITLVRNRTVQSVIDLQNVMRILD